MPAPPRQVLVVDSGAEPAVWAGGFGLLAPDRVFG
jgi:hypothetical protein